MGTEVIKSFLVGLGFGVSDSDLAKFNKAIASATLKVSAMYGAIQLMAGATFKTISGISQGFEEMGYEYRIISPMINRTLLFRRELLRAYRAAGMNITEVVRNAVKLNYSITRTQYAFQAIYRSVASRFFPLLTKQSDLFRAFLYKNMPRIQASLSKMVEAVFKAFDATLRLGERLWSILGRVYDFFVQLDKQTNGWSTTILAVLAAWKFLNLEFLATPLGMLITGFVALLALWDDFKTYKEGGLSLIDWGSQTTKIVVGVTGIVAALTAGFYALRTAIAAVRAAQWLWNAAMTANPIGLIIAGVTALIALLGVLAYKMGWLKGLTGWVGSIGDKMMNFAGGGALPGGALPPNFVGPLLPGTGPAQPSVNQTLNSQTTVNVNGAADAASVGKNVANQQDRVNSNLSRNLRGAVR